MPGRVLANPARGGRLSHERMTLGHASTAFVFWMRMKARSARRDGRGAARLAGVCSGRGAVVEILDQDELDRDRRVCRWRRPQLGTQLIPLGRVG